MLEVLWIDGKMVVKTCTEWDAHFAPKPKPKPKPKKVVTSTPSPGTDFYSQVTRRMEVPTEEFVRETFLSGDWDGRPNEEPVSFLESVWRGGGSVERHLIERHARQIGWLMHESDQYGAVIIMTQNHEPRFIYGRGDPYARPLYREGDANLEGRDSRPWRRGWRFLTGREQRPLPRRDI